MPGSRGSGGGGDAFLNLMRAIRKVHQQPSCERRVKTQREFVLSERLHKLYPRCTCSTSCFTQESELRKFGKYFLNVV